MPRSSNVGHGHREYIFDTHRYVTMTNPRSMINRTGDPPLQYRRAIVEQFVLSERVHIAEPAPQLIRRRISYGRRVGCFGFGLIRSSWDAPSPNGHRSPFDAGIGR
jgi:hypothetical protein